MPATSWPSPSASFSFLAGCDLAGVLVGAKAPVVLTSGADSAKAKLYSIALAVFLADVGRSLGLKGSITRR